jgi:hypothetical protein
VQTHVDGLFLSCFGILKIAIYFFADLEETGSIPFDILKPVLQRASAETLRRIETRNPVRVLCKF